MNIYTTLFLLLYSFCFSQDYPQNFFSAPLAIDLSVNGSFGELRFNHFHSGIDFGSNRKLGVPVFASADGEVNRIQINEKGFGKAIYIKHSNGFTTVYAHLDSYADDFQLYVKQNQYKEKKYTIELFPLKNELKVKKGDIIGYLGNTGSSAGPHLHFEIRDTQSEEIINPFLFGFDSFVNDIEKPIINSLFVYPLSDDARVNGEFIPTILSLSKQKEGVYIAQNVLAKGTFGFGINSYDVMNNKYSKNGLYKIEGYLNGSNVFEVVFDRFNFDETRKINLFIDYEFLTSTRQSVQKLFRTTNFDLSFYKKVTNNGQIDIQEGDSYNYKIVISDFHHNQTEINVPISFDTWVYEVIKKTESHLKKIDSKRDYIFSEQNGTVEWTALTFYEDFFLDIVFFENEIKLHKDNIPLDKSIIIQFDLKNLNFDIEKSFIGLVKGNSISYFHTTKRNDVLSIRTRSLGTYKVFEDFDLPIVKSVNFSDNNILSINDVLVFEVTDDLSGIKSIEGFINDQWALFEYEYKNKQITHVLKDGIAKKGLNKVEIKVSDNVGNSVIFETNFKMN